MEHEDKGILAALRQEPEQTAFLVKFSLVAVAAILAWDILGGMALPAVAVKAVAGILVLAYGATVTFVVARIMLTARPAVAAMAPARRMSTTAREQRSGEETGSERAVPRAVDSTISPVFNEQYFAMRLREQVKDARRDGRSMSVVCIDINVPGGEITREDADRIAFEMARIGAQQSKVIGQPLAMSESEYVFSMPVANPDDAKLFVREVVQALGDYWCHFGIASFPNDATDAERLVERAREACEVSRQGGRPGRVA